MNPLRWLREHAAAILLGLLMILIMALVIIYGIGLDCLLHGIDCPPVCNTTGSC